MDFIETTTYAANLEASELNIKVRELKLLIMSCWNKSKN